MNDIITITGNLAADPDMRQTTGGVPVVNFRVGSTIRKFDRQSGAWSDGGTNWYSVSAFRALGQHAFDSLRKGSPVVVTGKLVLREWESGGVTRHSADIEAETIGLDLRWGPVSANRDSGVSAPARADEAAWSAPGTSPEWPTATPGGAGESAADAPASATDGPTDADDDAAPHRSESELAGAPTPF